MTEQILAVQKMQDYIEAHLTEEITLAALADTCNFSPWYAHRLFREYTGFAPAEYIRRMRLAKSAQRLKTEHTRIIDVAFDLGFASVDGYTRAFRKEFGINPGEYAKNPVPVKLFVAYGVKFKELRKEFSVVANVNVFIQEALKLIITLTTAARLAVMYGEYFSAWIACVVNRCACGFRNNISSPKPQPMYRVLRWPRITTVQSRKDLTSSLWMRVTI